MATRPAVPPHPAHPRRQPRGQAKSHGRFPKSKTSRESSEDPRMRRSANPAGSPPNVARHAPHTCQSPHPRAAATATPRGSNAGPNLRRHGHQARNAAAPGSDTATVQRDRTEGVGNRETLRDPARPPDCGGVQISRARCPTPPDTGATHAGTPRPLAAAHATPWGSNTGPNLRRHGHQDRSATAPGPGTANVQRSRTESPAIRETLRESGENTRPRRSANPVGLPTDAT